MRLLAYCALAFGIALTGGTLILAGVAAWDSFRMQLRGEKQPGLSERMGYARRCPHCGVCYSANTVHE